MRLTNQIFSITSSHEYHYIRTEESMVTKLSYDVLANADI